MRKLIATLAAACLCAPLVAAAAEGWVVADISLQAGPDTDYPSIAELDAGTPISVRGCIDGWSWCDVIAGDDRGWVPGTFIEEDFGGRPVVIIEEGARIGIPIVSFSIGAYWGSHYHNRPFYAERARFESHAVTGHAPPRPNSIVATAPRRDAHPRPASGSTVMQGQATQGTLPTPDRSTERTRTATRTPLQQRSQQQQEQTQARAPASEREVTRERDPQRAGTLAQRPQAKPADAAPQMKPVEPQSQPMHERPLPAQTQIARQKDEAPKAKPRQEGPKPKDELKQPEKNKKDNGDNGGG